jgi:hypothetical protein
VLKLAFLKSEQSTQVNTRHRHIVNIHDPADLFHAILCYAYTNKITFTTDPETRQDPSAIYLDRVEEFYGLAHCLLLDGLAEKALTFLTDTCSIENITARAFGKFGDKFRDVGEVYTEFLLDNDPEEFQRVNGVLD